MEKIVEEYKIVKRQNTYSGNIKVEEITVSHDDKESTIEVLDSGNSIGALVYNKETKKYLFTERYRPCVDGLMIEIVTGSINEGEKPQDSIKREVAEVLGYKVDEMIHISDFYVSPSNSKEIVALFYVEVSENIGDGTNDIKIVEVDDLGMSGNLFFDLPKGNGDIVPPYKLIDSKSIMAVNAHIQNKMLRELWTTMSDYKMKSL